LPLAFCALPSRAAYQIWNNWIRSTINSLVAEEPHAMRYFEYYKAGLYNQNGDIVFIFDDALLVRKSPTSKLDALEK